MTMHTGEVSGEEERPCGEGRRCTRCDFMIELRPDLERFAPWYPDPPIGRWGPRNPQRDAAIVREAHKLFILGEATMDSQGRWRWSLLGELQHRVQEAMPRISADSAVDVWRPGVEPGISEVHQVKWNSRPTVVVENISMFMALLAFTALAANAQCLAASPGVTGATVAAVHDAALHAVTDAIDVRDSIVRDDPTISRERVGRFAATYLDMAGTEAVGNALLHLPLAPDDPGGDYGHERTPDLIGDLKRETRRQRRALRLITDTQLIGRCVASLDEPAPRPEPGLATVGDKVACLRPQPDSLPELAGEFEDPRTIRVLSRLSEMERTVAEAYAFGGGITWAEAQVLAGALPGYGERVRRKLSRLGDQFAARSAAVQLRRAA